MSSPLVIAHRGNSSVAPENTLPAFAASAAADMIEIDLRPTGDGQALVIHDALVDRTTDASGAVAEMDTVELGRLDAGSWFDPGFAGTPMPLLADILALLQRRPGLDLLLELKKPWDAKPLEAALAEITSAGLGQRVLVQSAAVELLELVREYAPDLRRGYLTSSYDEQVQQVCADLDVVACNTRFNLLLDRPEVLNAIHDAGQQCMAWTPNTPGEWERLIDLGVDGIITDRPDHLTGWLAGRAG